MTMMRRFNWPACRGFLLTLVFTLVTCFGWMMFLSLTSAEHGEGGEGEGGGHGEEVTEVPTDDHYYNTTEGGHGSGDHSTEEGDHHGSEGGGGEHGSEEGGAEDHGSGGHGEEGGGEGGGHGGGGGHGDVDPIVQITTAVLIIVILMVITIIFEAAKHKVEHMADKITKPAIQSLYGELTVLGFLSMASFILIQAGFFEALSNKVYGDEESLLHLFEQIHYVIFFVMVSFLVQVLRVLHYAPKTYDEWKVMENHCRDDHRMREVFQIPPKERRYSEEELILYYNLRKEFILNRSVEPPFAPSSHPLPKNFDFATYLYYNFGECCCEIVEVELKTWVLFILCTLVFYCVALAAHNELDVIKWIWLGAGWVIMIIGIAFNWYLDGIKRSYVPTNSLSSSSQYVPESLNFNLEEETLKRQQEQPLSGSSKKGSATGSLPRWCEIDLDKYMAKRGCLTKKISHHHEPTRQDALYLLEREGHELHLMAYQVGIITMDGYLGILLVLFANHLHSVEEAFFFLLLGLAPFMAIIGYSRRQMKDLAIVGCMGSYRNKVIVNRVLREEKTAHAVRAFLVLEKMHRHAQEDFRRSTIATNPFRKSVVVADMEKSEVEILGRTFDAFDTDGNGSITHEELITMLGNFGANNTQAIKCLIGTLDTNNHGYITRREFIRWYSKNMSTGNIHERAQNLFQMFDKDGDGEISLAEFQIALDAFKMGFTIDEIGMIVTELNDEGGITVGLEQFVRMLERYSPEDASTKDGSSSNNNNRPPPQINRNPYRASEVLNNPPPGSVASTRVTGGEVFENEPYSMVDSSEIMTEIYI